MAPDVFHLNGFAHGSLKWNAPTLVVARSSSDLAGLYSHAAVYVLPAKYEPFGLSVLEAATWGCALVLGDISSLRENWDGAAMFVDPDDSAALSNTIERVMKDEHLRSHLASAAMNRASQFTAAKMAREYHFLYSDLVTSRARHSRFVKEAAVCV
jgi:glycosyltransferase involved in cell wall biosynthesis